MKTKVFALFLGLASMSAFSNEASKDDQSSKSELLDTSCGRLTPRTLSYVCNRINESASVSNCYAAGRDAYLDQCALGACDRYSTVGGTIACIQTIANRSYMLDEVLNCDAITTENASNSCFASSGRPVSGDTGGTNEVRMLKRGIVNAIELLRREQNAEARALLEDLLIAK